MHLRGTDPESYITEYTSVYEDESAAETCRGALVGGAGGHVGLMCEETLAKWLVRCCFISHQVFSRSFCRGQLPYESVNLSFTITNIKKKLTDLCGN